jgi:hypothetical protein
MGFAVAKGTNDPPEVRNKTIHFIALIVSMAYLCCKNELTNTTTTSQYTLVSVH